MKKYEKREWQNERGQGYLMNVDFKDPQGSEIQATFFKEAADFFEPLIFEGHVYLVSNGLVKKSNKKFIDNPYSLSFDR